MCNPWYVGYHTWIYDIYILDFVNGLFHEPRGTRNCTLMDRLTVTGWARRYEYMYYTSTLQYNKFNCTIDEREPSLRGNDSSQCGPPRIMSTVDDTDSMIHLYHWNCKTWNRIASPKTRWPLSQFTIDAPHRLLLYWHKCAQYMAYRKTSHGCLQLWMESWTMKMKRRWGHHLPQVQVSDEWY